MIDELKRLKEKGTWNEFKGTLKQEFGDLTEDDMTYLEGKEDEFFGRLQQKLGVKKDELSSKLRGVIDKMESEGQEKK